MDVEGPCPVWAPATPVQVVISLAQVTHLCTEDEFVVLASDGFWDVISNEVACELVHKYMREYELDLVPQKLVDRAYRLGSDDNITVTVVFFTYHLRAKAASVKVAGTV